MIKVLIQQEQITSYRIDIFNLISKYYDLTIVHKGPLISKNLVFFKQEIRKIYKIGPLFFQNFTNLTKGFDVIITSANLRFLNNFFLSILPRKFKWITWGIGVSASYKKKFDINKKYDFLRYLIFGKSDALIFYSAYPVKKYLANGVNITKIFVAHNTYSNKCGFQKQRDCFVFIGSLFEEKGLMELIKQYKFALSYVGKDLLPLKIIGGGKLEKPIKKSIEENNLKNKIQLLGPIFEKKKINRILSKALLSISPKQAGLAVLHSMSCGVAFVTSKESITGGEIFNITNNYNGVIYKTSGELQNIIIDAHNNPIKYIAMGSHAHEYYYKNRTGSKMVKSFIKAINQVTKSTDK